MGLKWCKITWKSLVQHLCLHRSERQTIYRDISVLEFFRKTFGEYCQRCFAAGVSTKSRKFRAALETTHAANVHDVFSAGSAHERKHGLDQKKRRKNICV